MPRLPRQQPRRQRRQLGTQARHQSQSSAISATPAMQSARPCHQAPHLPRKSGGRCRQVGPKRATRASAVPEVPLLPHRSATPATQSAGRCHQAPRLPRKVKVDVTKCHASHANSRGDNGVNWDPSAPPEPVQCHKRHACHAK